MITFNNTNLCEYCFEPITGPSGHCSRCGSLYDARRFPGTLAVGDVLHGEYLVGKVLGKGGFGVTYLCYDLKESKKVAIKEYFPQSLAHRDSGQKQIRNTQEPEIYKNGADKFYREAKLLYECRNIPEIVRVEKLFQENNTMYFVMEYLVGGDLEKYFRNDPHPDENFIIYIAMEVLKSLRMLHGRAEPILHLDISPDNIIICASGAIKLIDFGASKVTVGTLSNSQTVFLKPGFAPKEQYSAKGKKGAWTDIYALGATMYYLLTHQVPPESITRMKEDSLDMSGISPELSGILRKMMAVQPEERFQTADEVSEALKVLQYRNTGTGKTREGHSVPSVTEEKDPTVVHDTDSKPVSVRWETLLLGILSFLGSMTLLCYLAWLIT